MHKVKILVVDSIGPNLDAIVGLLKCFPFLERLYVIVSIQTSSVFKYENQHWVRLNHDPLNCCVCVTNSVL